MCSCLCSVSIFGCLNMKEPLLPAVLEETTAFISCLILIPFFSLLTLLYGNQSTHNPLHLFQCYILCVTVWAEVGCTSKSLGCSFLTTALLCLTSFQISTLSEQKRLMSTRKNDRFKADCGEDFKTGLTAEIKWQYRFIFSDMAWQMRLFFEMSWGRRIHFSVRHINKTRGNLASDSQTNAIFVNKGGMFHCGYF